MLFSSYIRTDSESKAHTEGAYEFLDRSARPAIERVRNCLEHLVAIYPSLHRRELIARMKSDDDHFRSASFELILYGALSKLGCELTPHPNPESGATTEPDFLVRHPEHEPFILECSCVSERGYLDKKTRARRDMIYDSLNKSAHKNFHIGITDESGPAVSPKIKDVGSYIHGWLNSLDPDEVIKEFDRNGHDALPRAEYSVPGWEVSFVAFPKKPDYRDTNSKLIYTYMDGGGFVDGWTPIRNRVTKKAGAYGDIKYPLVIAINKDSFSDDRIDETDALFGAEQVVDIMGPDGVRTYYTRQPNGAWFGPAGPRNSRNSAVWVFNDLNPYTIMRRQGVLYLNPHARRPIPDFLRRFTTAERKNGRIEVSDGKEIGDAFGLSKTWPE